MTSLFDVGKSAIQAYRQSLAVTGQNIANPTSLILSAAMMLSWLGEQRGEQNLMSAGTAITEAVDAVLDNPENRTRDLGGSVNTDQFGYLVANAVTAG